MIHRTTSRTLVAAAVCGALSLLASANVTAQTRGSATGIFLVPGVDEAGDATDLWHSILRRRLSSAEYQQFADIRKPLNEEELAWNRLILSRTSAWETQLAAIELQYRPAPPPPRVLVVLGNRGANDAFTHDPTTIGFDLAALHVAYGDAANDGNVDRIDRLFRHEYAHLMQKSWLRDHPYDARTPLRAAFKGIWLEALGNYYSMSSKWRAESGTPSPRSSEALSLLQPRFCARLAALACAVDDSAERLTDDMTKGRFDRKWGALTAALWLEEEMSVSSDAYRRLVEAGPDAIPAMAIRHLPVNLAAVFEEALRAETLCTP